VEIAQGAGQCAEKMGGRNTSSPLQHKLKAMHPRTESRENSLDFGLLPQDELNLFKKEGPRALNEESELSDDGNGQLTLNPGMYVSPSLAQKIATRSRNPCPPRCILRSRKSMPKEKRRISWCNPVVQDMQAPPEDSVIGDYDDDENVNASNARYLHRAGAFSKSFLQSMRPCTTTCWTSKKSSPRNQRIVMATFLGIMVIATAAAALGSFGAQDFRLFMVLSFMSERLCPTWFLSVASVLQRVLQASVCLGFLVLQLMLMAWLANKASGSSVENDADDNVMHRVSGWRSQQK